MPVFNPDSLKRPPLAPYSVRLVLFVAWLALVMPVAAKAEDVAGRVISVTGEVIATRPESTDERPLDRRDDVFVSETIITRQNSRTQIRFRDEGLIDLRPNSVLEIETYEIAEAEGEAGRAVMNFTQGALRTVTGRIGSGEQDEYRIDTAAASIGIRGTDYALQYCDANCPEGATPDGLFGRVNEGAIVLTNDVGTFELRTGEYFFLPDAQSTPQILPSPPAGILDGSDDGEPDDEEEEDDDSEENGAPETVSAPVTDDADDDDDDLDLNGFVQRSALDDLDEEELEDLLDLEDTDDDDIVDDDDDETDTDLNGEDEPFVVPEDIDLVDQAMSGVFRNSDSPSYGGQFFGGLIRGDGFETGTEESEETGIPLPVVTAADFPDNWKITDTSESDFQESSFGLWRADDQADSTVYWGRWGESGSIELTDPEGDTDTFSLGSPGFYYIFSEDLTEYEQIQDLKGEMSYSPYLASLQFESKNNLSYEPDLNNDFLFEFLVDFGASTVDMTVAADLGNVTFDIEEAGIKIEELYQLTFPFDGEWDDGSYAGAIDGQFDGQFVGVDADGIIYFLDMELLRENNELYDQVYNSGLLTQEKPVLD